MPVLYNFGLPVVKKSMTVYIEIEGGEFHVKEFIEGIHSTCPNCSKMVPAFKIVEQYEVLGQAQAWKMRCSEPTILFRCACKASWMLTAQLNCRGGV